MPPELPLEQNHRSRIALLIGSVVVLVLLGGAMYWWYVRTASAPVSQKGTSVATQRELTAEEKRIQEEVRALDALRASHVVATQTTSTSTSDMDALRAQTLKHTTTTAQTLAQQAQALDALRTKSI